MSSADPSYVVRDVNELVLTGCTDVSQSDEDMYFVEFQDDKKSELLEVSLSGGKLCVVIYASDLNRRIPFDMLMTKLRSAADDVLERKDW